MKRPMKQVDISQGVVHRTLWVDAHPALTTGGTISLKDENGLWHVDKLYEPVLDIEQLNSQRNFDNNNYDVHKGLFNVRPANYYKT